MSDDKPVKHVIHARLRRMGAAYALATAIGLLLAIWTQSSAVFIGVAIAAVGVIVFFITTERNARKDNFE
ncbi:hypothetical protein [uncultured Citricoccus sp.]|uniref:hypothetical protein n=1 Tax=uncultured Citricoccus sp. TaxID=614031 RepID=UPI0026101692|nr:hypothetical protein [uncultured Citricoccus sp.]